ncbi:hypothetical protein [Streptomyces tauricus]|uniref:hypothetical protein n=1 Tax=Streptomyces tauricus TaxID=68274 RepID=UPI0038183D2A
MRISATKIELDAATRRYHRAGLAGRALERKYGVTWQTVRRAADSNWPEPRTKQAPRPIRLDPYKPVVDGMPAADLDAPPQQRRTVKRIFDRVVDGYEADGISYQMVRGQVRVRRKEIRWGAGRGAEEVFVPQSHAPGDEARVDFGGVRIVLAKTFTGPRLCAAIVGWLTFGGNMAETGTESYRLARIEAGAERATSQR